MAAVKRDYYEVLGVSRDADEDAIRRSFSVLARDWHPDVADSPDAEERFRELAEAYSVLSRRESKLLYDRYGSRAHGNEELDDTPSEEAPPEVARGEDVHTDVELRRFEADEGTRRVLTFHAGVRCTACMGRGTPGLPDPECDHCGGTGRKRTLSHLEAAQTFQIEACPACVGKPCARCGGTGTVPAERRIGLRIPPGVEDGTELWVSADGNEAGVVSAPGDSLVLVRVHVLPPAKEPRVVRYVAFALLLVAIAALVFYLVR